MSPSRPRRGARADAAEPRYIARNRASWYREADDYQRDHGSQRDRFDKPRSGTFGIPDDTLGVLGDVAGLDVLEFGCGGGQWSIALERRGAHPVGLDLSIRQLAHARTLAERASARVPFVNANAERTQFADQRLDDVLDDHGPAAF